LNESRFGPFEIYLESLEAEMNTFEWKLLMMKSWTEMRLFFFAFFIHLRLIFNDGEEIWDFFLGFDGILRFFGGLAGF
jgi:hypothetical protein